MFEYCYFNTPVDPAKMQRRKGGVNVERCHSSENDVLFVKMELKKKLESKILTRNTNRCLVCDSPVVNGITLYAFPKDCHVRRQWWDFVSQNTDEMSSKNLQICSQHFSKSCWEVVERKTGEYGLGLSTFLKDEAVPTIYDIPRNTSEETCSPTKYALLSKMRTAPSFNNVTKEFTPRKLVTRDINKKTFQASIKSAEKMFETCTVCGALKRGSVILHRLPSAIVLKMKWLNFVEQSTDNIKETPMRSIRICSQHFDDSCYNEVRTVVNGFGMKVQRIMASDAVPSIFWIDGADRISRVEIRTLEGDDEDINIEATNAGPAQEEAYEDDSSESFSGGGCKKYIEILPMTDESSPSTSSNNEQGPQNLVQTTRSTFEQLLTKSLQIHSQTQSVDDMKKSLVHHEQEENCKIQTFFPEDHPNGQTLLACEDPYCGEGFLSKELLLEHKKSHLHDQTTVVFVCCVCNAKFHSFRSYNSHLGSHFGEKNRLCFICGHAMSSMVEVQRHFKREHGSVFLSVKGRKGTRKKSEPETDSAPESECEFEIEIDRDLPGESTIEHSDEAENSLLLGEEGKDNVSGNSMKVGIENSIPCRDTDKCSISFNKLTGSFPYESNSNFEIGASCRLVPHISQSANYNASVTVSHAKRRIVTVDQNNLYQSFKKPMCLRLRRVDEIYTSLQNSNHLSVNIKDIEHFDPPVSTGTPFPSIAGIKPLDVTNMKVEGADCFHSVSGLDIATNTRRKSRKGRNGKKNSTTQRKLKGEPVLECKVILAKDLNKLNTIDGGQPDTVDGGQPDAVDDGQLDAVDGLVLDAGNDNLIPEHNTNHDGTLQIKIGGTWSLSSAGHSDRFAVEIDSHMERCVVEATGKHQKAPIKNSMGTGNSSCSDIESTTVKNEVVYPNIMEETSNTERISDELFATRDLHVRMDGVTSDSAVIKDHDDATVCTSCDSAEHNKMDRILLSIKDEPVDKDYDIALNSIFGKESMISIKQEPVSTESEQSKSYCLEKLEALDKAQYDCLLPELPSDIYTSLYTIKKTVSNKRGKYKKRNSSNKVKEIKVYFAQQKAKNFKCFQIEDSSKARKYRTSDIDSTVESKRPNTGGTVEYKSFNTEDTVESKPPNTGDAVEAKPPNTEGTVESTPPNIGDAVEAKPPNTEDTINCKSLYSDASTDTLFFDTPTTVVATNNIPGTSGIRKSKRKTTSPFGSRNLNLFDGDLDPSLLDDEIKPHIKLLKMRLSIKKQEESKRAAEFFPSNVIPGLTKFECSDCGEGFHHSLMLKEHNKRHSKVTPFICWICSSQFQEYQTYMSHLTQHIGKNIRICSICGFRVSTVKNLKSHIAEHVRTNSSMLPEDSLTPKTKAPHPLDPYSCALCQVCCGTPSGLKTHLLSECSVVKIALKPKSRTPLF